MATAIKRRKIVKDEVPVSVPTITSSTESSVLSHAKSENVLSNTQSILANPAQAIVNALEQSENKCLRESQMAALIPGLTLQTQETGLNTLLQEGRIKLLQDPDKGELLIELISLEDMAKFAGLTAEDMLVYRLIEKSNNMGIWIRDIRIRSNLQGTKIPKILKNLEKRDLIKAHQTCQAQRKKVYMLKDIKPSPEVTGGIWYSGHEFDSKFIVGLRQLIAKALVVMGCASTRELSLFINGAGISKVELSDKDLQCVIDTMIYDNVIEQVPDMCHHLQLRTEFSCEVDFNGRRIYEADCKDPIVARFMSIPSDQNTKYRVAISGASTNAFVSPCFSCPLLFKKELGLISVAVAANK